MFSGTVLGISFSVGIGDLEDQEVQALLFLFLQLVSLHSQALVTLLQQGLWEDARVQFSHQPQPFILSSAAPKSAPEPS